MHLCYRTITVLSVVCCTANAIVYTAMKQGRPRLYFDRTSEPCSLYSLFFFRTSSFLCSPTCKTEQSCALLTKIITSFVNVQCRWARWCTPRLLEHTECWSRRYLAWSPLERQVALDRWTLATCIAVLLAFAESKSRHSIAFH